MAKKKDSQKTSQTNKKVTGGKTVEKKTASKKAVKPKAKEEKKPKLKTTSKTIKTTEKKAVKPPPKKTPVKKTSAKAGGASSSKPKSTTSKTKPPKTEKAKAATKSKKEKPAANLKSAPADSGAQQAKSSKLKVSFEDTKPVSTKPRITHSRNGNLLYQLEYTIRSSPTILFDFLTSPSGLAQWFADSVDINEPYCSFVWEGYEDNATIIDAVEDEYVRYRWDYSTEDEYFEFRITKNEITGDTVLVITDFAPTEDVEDQKLLWDSQVKKLIQQVGG